MTDRKGSECRTERTHPVSPERQVSEGDELAEVDQLEREGMPGGMTERETPSSSEKFSSIVPMDTGKRTPTVECTDQACGERWPMTNSDRKG